MNHNGLPDLGKCAMRLAENAARVTRCLEPLPDRVESLVAALRQSDWQEIRRLTENIASGETQTYDTIRYRAERVCEELKKPNNLHAIKQSVVRLIGACGTTIYDKNAESKRADWSI